MCMTKSGDMFDCEITIKKMTGAQERTHFFTVIFRDITERKRAENELKRFNNELEKRVAIRTSELESSKAFLAAILDSTMDAILTIDHHGTIQSINESSINLFGFEEVELLGKNLSEILHESYRSECQQNISRINAGKKKSERDE